MVAKRLFDGSYPVLDVVSRRFVAEGWEYGDNLYHATNGSAIHTQ